MASVHQFGGQKSMTQIYFEVCINTDMLTTKLSGMQQNIVSQSLKKVTKFLDILFEMLDP